jgi:hypothetical protein
VRVSLTVAVRFERGPCFPGTFEVALSCCSRLIRWRPTDCLRRAVGFGAAAAAAVQVQQAAVGGAAEPHRAAVCVCRPQRAGRPGGGSTGSAVKQPGGLQLELLSTPAGPWSGVGTSMPAHGSKPPLSSD